MLQGWWNKCQNESVEKVAVLSWEEVEVEEESVFGVEEDLWACSA